MVDRPMPRLAALATASPEHVLRQSDVAEAGRRLFGSERDGIERLLPIYNNAGIERRQSCMPLEWYLEEHSFSERNRLYREHAVALLAQAADRCLEEAGLQHDEIDTIVTVSTSGIATPGLDAHLMTIRPFRQDVQRLPIFGLGCVGGVLGLARAGALAKAEPASHVLFLCVELCGLTFRRDDHSKSNFVATALFGDGAAAALITTEGKGPALARWGEHTWADSLDVMGWDVADDGFGVVFSRNIPNLVRAQMRQAASRFAKSAGFSLHELDNMICHPGGAKVLDALEDAFGLEPGTMVHARETLRLHGNMSAATILFVLERALKHEPPGRWLLSSLGPGFTAGFLLLEG
ncbi:MAG: 3-oxoacyl-[acyl-carrier-protein] synthase III C-terminal domain-containing protein [Alphaproteobacteria bacterium]|jgi:alkylresorcinol/alkylpyrone synthase|nr:type III polyketide synthase [Rhodospirillaceae bacterium]MBT6509963.1 type III polyketide synthase [Rhodospirillaceae bacterium]MBT7614172.1 type III polyketide synthase [Rhodospirillaceae bacterium]MBT7645733.1 type III polyketide synthase [Rhodospirillaceae bacterium]MDG2479805.1 3-oxoacyl-[acyl-carrier-protein] synthase III C-terminal domain-containing protein [Alphaproteobacteria bacterium]